MKTIVNLAVLIVFILIVSGGTRTVTNKNRAVCIADGVRCDPTIKNSCCTVTKKCKTNGDPKNQMFKCL